MKDPHRSSSILQTDKGGKVVREARRFVALWGLPKVPLPSIPQLLQYVAAVVLAVALSIGSFRLGNTVAEQYSVIAITLRDAEVKDPMTGRFMSDVLEQDGRTKITYTMSSASVGPKRLFSFPPATPTPDPALEHTGCGFTGFLLLFGKGLDDRGNLLPQLKPCAAEALMHDLLPELQRR
jgi:hypothetical protein